MGYEPLDKITRADVAFRIFGEDLNELFLSGAEALVSVMIENRNSILYKIEKIVEFKNTEIDLILYDFLQEIIFFKDSESIILFPKSMDFRNSDNIYRLTCIFHGEHIDSKRHGINLDVKAVTMHNLSIEKSNKGWRATFVLDV